MQFNRYTPSKEYECVLNNADQEAVNLYEITENLEEYYQQKAPNLWNAWVRTNNMLVEQQEKIDKLEKMINDQKKEIVRIGGFMEAQDRYIKPIYRTVDRIEKAILKTKEQQQQQQQQSNPQR